MGWKHQSKWGAFFIMALIAFQYIVASLAFADFGFAPPVADDMSRSFLNQIFGSLLDGGQDAFGASIISFNSAILIVGGILAAYTIFAGTIGTAHHGEMLGKKFASEWLPIRYAVGTALVLPVLSGGYCVMQGIVMWIIMQGVSIANGVWTEYMKNPPGLAALAASAPNSSTITLVENAYLAQVCVVAQTKINSQSGGGAYSGYGSNFKYGVTKRKTLSPFASSFSHPDANKYWHFGSLGNTRTQGTCGKLSYPETDSSDTNVSGTNTITQSVSGKDYNVPSFNNLKTIFKSPDFSSIINAHYAGIDKIVAETGVLADLYVPNKGETAIIPDDAYSKLYKIAEDYHHSIIAAALPAINSQAGVGGIADAATSSGWFIAGAWATQIIIVQNKLNSAINASGTFTELRFAPEIRRQNQLFTDLVSPAIVMISDNNQIANAFLQATVNTKDTKSETPGTFSATGNVARWLSNMITGLDLKAIKDDKRHPLIIMSTIGNAILSSVIAATMIIAGFAAGAGIASILNLDFAPIFITFYGTFAIPIAGFIGIGATLAYLLPNMPFLLWMGIIIGWTVMCVEAIIAAPLWAVMHLHPNGDDMTGRGGNGYMLVLGLVLRPVLIIFGLIAAITLSGLFGQLVNLIFLDTFTMNQGDGSLNFFATIFGSGLYAAIMMMVIKQTFNLMYVIPDQLLRWVGGGQEQLGQYAGASVDSMTKASAIGGAAVGLVAEKGIQAAQGGFNQMKGLNEAKAQQAGLQQQERSSAEASVGPGASAAYAGIDSSFGGNKKNSNLNAISQKSELSQISGALGGSSSSATSSFLDKYNEAKGAGSNHGEARDIALTHSLNSNFGDQSAQMVSKLSGASGQSNVNANGASSFNFGNKLDTARAISSVSGLHNKISSSGKFTRDEAKVAVNEICSNTNSSVSNNDNTSAVRQAFSSNSDIRFD